MCVFYSYLFIFPFLEKHFDLFRNVISNVLSPHDQSHRVDADHLIFPVDSVIHPCRI